MAGEAWRSGASSTAPMAIKPKVTSSRAAPLMEVGWGCKKALGWEQWKRRSAEEGQTIAQPQHLYNPRLRTPVPPGLPMEGQTTAGKGPERRWLPPPETRRPGRRSPPPLTPLKRLRPSVRKEEEERFPYGLPRVKDQPAGEPQKGSQPHDTEWKNRRCTKTS